MGMNSIIIFFAQYMIYVLIGLAFLVWLRFEPTEKKKFLFTFVLGGILAFILAKIGSLLYFDPRPFTHPGVTALIPHASDNGFPSDHTLLAMLFAATVFCFDKWYGSGLFVVAASVGVARIAAHVHSPIDIIGATLISGVAVYVAYTVQALYWNKKAHE